MNELEALRSVAQILAPVATPIERQNIARRVAQKTKGDDSEIALSLPHAAALFWPGDAEKTAEVLRQITLAFDAGELGGFLPREHRHILFTELTVWPDCPPMAADSPLRHWVPDAPAKPQAAPAPVVADSADDGEAWKAKARERADEIIKRQRAKDLHPSQEDIADEIAREFRADGVMGAGGKPLTGAYIKRHALKGISSAQNRQLSTSIRRGK